MMRLRWMKMITGCQYMKATCKEVNLKKTKSEMKAAKEINKISPWRKRSSKLQKLLLKNSRSKSKMKSGKMKFKSQTNKRKPIMLEEKLKKKKINSALFVATTMVRTSPKNTLLVSMLCVRIASL